jgi:hypothetical protein
MEMNPHVENLVYACDNMVVMRGVIQFGFLVVVGSPNELVKVVVNLLPIVVSRPHEFAIHQGSLID